MSKALTQVAERFAIDEQELQDIIFNTVMPANKKCSREQFTTFIAVANEYKLSPLTKEIYAFPTQGGGIQPIVSIDGWLKIINSHPEFNGMTFEDKFDGDKLVSVTCNIYKKGIEHSISVTEYMTECFNPNSQPWKKWPSRMLRHKAVIQGGRYAFGLSGIIDPDEADRFKDAGVIQDEKEVEIIQAYTDEQFKGNLEAWSAAILDDKKTPQQMIAFIESKGGVFTEEQKQTILDLKGNE